MSHPVLEQNIITLKEYHGYIEKCFSMLSEDIIWSRLNEYVNPVGVQVVHVCGNMHQYILSGLAKTPDHRNRDAEFEIKQDWKKEELLQLLNSTIENVCKIIAQTTEQSLMENYQVQGFHMDGWGLIQHVTQHFCYHCGQIALLTKFYTNQETLFYDGIDLNLLNKK